MGPVISFKQFRGGDDTDRVIMAAPARRCIHGNDVPDRDLFFLDYVMNAQRSLKI
jgi:hypothetical protein